MIKCHWSINMRIKEQLIEKKLVETVNRNMTIIHPIKVKNSYETAWVEMSYIDWLE